MQSALTWFELPTTNFDRAVEFYSSVLGKPLQKMVFNGTPNGIFPYDAPGIGGSVVYDPSYQPSASAAIIYLAAVNEAELDAMIARVEPAGGKVLLPKTDIGNPGHMALIMDTEGNRVGLNAPRA